MDRHPRNPILTRRHIPDVPPFLSDVSSVFNPGAIKDGTTYRLILRVQDRSRETYFLPAASFDGWSFEVEPHIIEFEGLSKLPGRIYHSTDARPTRLEGTVYILFAMDGDEGCRLGLGRTTDFKRYEFLGPASDEDVRDGVLFPEKVGGRYLRIDRPDKARPAGGPSSGGAIRLSGSDDLLAWKPIAPLIHGRLHFWDEFIGSGSPPVKTRRGWLHVYHGAAGRLGNAAVTQAGVVLLDLNDPSRVLGRCRRNVLEPREIYELTGQVPNVVFPSGMIVEDYDADGFARPDSEVKIYYGAADTCIGLATTTIGDLLRAAGEDAIPQSR